MLYVTKINANQAVKRLIEQGVPALALPLLSPVQYKITAPWPQIDAIIITSAQACVPCESSAPTYCVGQATATAARTAGYNVVYVGTGGVDTLCTQLPPVRRVLYLRGIRVRHPIEQLLPQCHCEQWVVYGLRLHSHTQNINPQGSVAFWSVQGIAAWRKLNLPTHMAQVLCISAAVAQAWGDDALYPPQNFAQSQDTAQVFIDFISNKMAP